MEVNPFFLILEILSCKSSLNNLMWIITQLTCCLVTLISQTLLSFIPNCGSQVLSPPPPPGPPPLHIKLEITCFKAITLDVKYQNITLEKKLWTCFEFCFPVHPIVQNRTVWWNNSLSTWGVLRWERFWATHSNPLVFVTGLCCAVVVISCRLPEEWLHW